MTLPGIGSYIALAIAQRDLAAIGWAIGALPGGRAGAVRAVEREEEGRDLGEARAAVDFCIPHRVLTDGVCELKVDLGPGYRVYYTERGGVLIILLAGGDKSTQQQDIRSAISLAKNLKEHS